MARPDPFAGFEQQTHTINGVRTAILGYFGPDTTAAGYASVAIDPNRSSALR